MIDIHGHRFEGFTLVSEIHANVDLVFGIKTYLTLKVSSIHETPASAF